MKRASSLRGDDAPIPPCRVSGAVSAVISSTSRRRFRDRGLLGAHVGACRLYRLDDVHIAGAPADIARQLPANLFFRGIRVAFQQCGSSNHHSRSAESALKGVLLVKALLHGMK